MKPTDQPKKLRRTHTATIFGCLFAYGLVYGVIGATLDDLQDIYRMTAQDVSQILVVRSAGFLVGSFVCGSIYKQVNAKIVIIVTLLAGGAGTAIVPDCAPHFWIAGVGQFMTGYSFGAVEVGANVWLVQLWEGAVNPMMQGYHVSYGIGSVLAPLLTTPFLGPKTNKTLNSTMEQQLDIFELDPDTPVNGTSHIAIPYGLFGGAYAFMGLVILFFFMIDRTELRQHVTEETDTVSDGSVARFEWTVVALLSVYIVAENTLETIMGNMLPLYVNRNPDLAMEKTSANYLLTFFWAAYTAGRITSILLSFKLEPRSSLILAQSITSIGAGVLLLLVLPATTGRLTAWLATGIIGFGVGPLYPTAFTWAVRYIHLKYAHMSAALIAACVGGMLPTYIVAPWVESSITAMPVVTAGCGALLVCILAAMLFTTRNRPPIYENDDDRHLIVNMVESDFDSDPGSELPKQ